MQWVLFILMFLYGVGLYSGFGSISGRGDIITDLLTGDN